MRISQFETIKFSEIFSVGNKDKDPIVPKGFFSVKNLTFFLLRKNLDKFLIFLT